MRNDPTREAAPLSKQDYEALAAFRYALRRFLHHVEEGARAAGITPQQHQLLLALKGQPGREWATVAEVATALQIKHHAAAGLVDRCAEAGLVTRVPSVEDRRRVEVHLTPEGDRILGRLSEANRSELASLRRALSLDFLADQMGE